MKRSIKWKIIITFLFVMVCCIGSILLFNSLFLEKFYMNEKKNLLKASYQTLNQGVMEVYKQGYELSDLFKPNKVNGTTVESSFIKFLRELQDSYNVIIVLMDKDNKVYSLFQSTNRYDRRIMNYIFKDGGNDTNLEILEETEEYTIAINTPKDRVDIEMPSVSDGGPSNYYENPGPSGAKDNAPPQNRPSGFFRHTDRNSNIECFGFLSDETTAFFMTIAVASIKEPIRLFNKILIILSIVAAFLGGIAIFVVSSNIAAPILKLSDLSKKMSRLEFENKYDGESEDEVGVLGNSMNEMSDKLEKTIKELKNANIALKKDLEQKEQLDLMRQEFVANVSHELKTPIALIEGYAEGLETEGIADSKENREYYIDVIKDEAEKMNKMVMQLLSLSELERGMSKLDIVRINLKEVVNGILKSLELRIKEKNADVNVDINDNCFVWADEYKLETVVKNYLTNALNYVDDNKQIKVFAETIDDNKIRFNVYNSGNCLADTDLKKVWEKFYKVDKARTREYGGTGLGLSIVKAIANEHSTVCDVYNIKGDTKLKDGVVFYFDFQTK